MSIVRRTIGYIIDRLPFFINRSIIYRYRFHIPAIKEKRKKLIEQIHSKNKANVLFIISSLSMWKYEDIFRLLVSDKRFSIYIILYPYGSYDSVSKRQSMEQLLTYFNKFNIAIYNCYIENLAIQPIIDNINPEVVFYQIPYEGVYQNELEYINFKDKLLCYAPYGIGTAQGNLFTNTVFHNIAWKIFSATELHKNIGVKESVNRGENIIVVGDGNATRFCSQDSKYDKWKNAGKRIIWAPHYSILDGHALHRTGFLWLSKFMLSIADQYNGRIQIAFKPHPKLKTLMYEHPIWGKKLTDKYYKNWEEGKNTILEEGDYADLFASSDAMIHDSSSFIGEYIYTAKPVLFTCKNMEYVRKECNSFGNECLNLHYIASTEIGVKRFIEDVVLNEEDSLKSKRERFRDKFLMINDGLTTGQRIYRNFLQEFGWE